MNLTDAPDPVTLIDLEEAPTEQITEVILPVPEPDFVMLDGILDPCWVELSQKLR